MAQIITLYIYIYIYIYIVQGDMIIENRLIPFEGGKRVNKTVKYYYVSIIKKI